MSERPLPDTMIRLRDGREARVYRWHGSDEFTAFAGQCIVWLSTRDLLPDNRLTRWRGR
jgi:hypothetical protein